MSGTVDAMTTKTSFAALVLGGVLWTAVAQAQILPGDRLSKLEAETAALAHRAGTDEVLLAQASPIPNSLAADFEVRLQKLERTISELTGRVEETEQKVTQIQDRLERMNGDFDFRFQALEKGGPAAKPPTVPAVSGAPAPPTLRTDAKPGDKPAEKPTEKPTVAAAPPPAGNDPQAEYERAYKLLGTEDWEKAEKAFSAFIAHNPKHPMAGNAQYWLGETFYVRKKYNEASVAFAEGFKNFPNNNKAPDNLLKLGLSLAQLNNAKGACTAYNQLLERFPAASPQIKKRAEEERRKSSCK